MITDLFKGKKNKITLYILLASSLIVLYFFGNPSTASFFPKCPLYSFTGLYCPGCGSQRATHALLHFNIVEIAQQNILYLLGVILASYHVLLLFINCFFKKNYTNYFLQTKSLIAILIIIIVFGILRNITLYPFYFLAPH